MKHLKSLLLLLVIAGLAASVCVLNRRHDAEERHRAVEIAVDLGEVRALAASSPQSVTDVFRSLKASGATSVAITEATMRDLLSTGQASLVKVGSREAGGLYSVRASSASVQAFLDEALRAEGFSAGALEMDPSEIAAIPLGFGLDRDIARVLRRDQGYRIIARAQNFPSPARFEALRAQTRELGAGKVIFAGDEVLGWRGAEGQAASLLESGRLLFGAIEFGKQKGSEKVERLLDGRYLRVHSISMAELANYQPAAAVERFVRAARERGIRVLFVHLPFAGGEGALEQNLDLLSAIERDLRRSGLAPGDASIVGDPQPSRLELVVMAAGVAAAAVLTLLAFFDLGLASALAWLMVTAFLLAALACFGDMGRKLVALAAALLFPAWAAARAARLSIAGQNGDRPLGLALVIHYLGAISIALFGGLFVAALLSGRVFMTATDQFAGVKVAHLLPVLMILFAASAGVLGVPLPPREVWAAAVRSARRIWSSPVLFGAAAVALLAIAALLIVVLRSGNDAGVGVSGLELRFRALLDRVLYVRPRTKEIFIGHPALWAAIWLMLRRETAWASVFFVAAALGLVSVLNTFCHIHTPLALSFARVFNGAWVGAIGGVALVWALRNLGLGANAKTG